MNNISENSKLIRSFGRIKTRTLSKGKQKKLDELLPKISIKIVTPHLLRGKKPLNPATLFNKNTKEIWLEIGFGFGEHIYGQAEKSENKNIGFIGCETHINSIVSLLGKIEKTNTKNIKIFNGDARLLLENLTDNSLSKVFILFPDPWPKKKHHKRRIINEEFLELLHKKMKSNSTFIFASDIDNYINWTIEKVRNHNKFSFPAKSKEDCENEPNGWICTRYQQKAIREGRKSRWLKFHKK